jgi:hypothetical protein
MKHINAALERLHLGGPVQVDNDSSLLQRILALDPNPKTACVLAIDMFLVGIDTVSVGVLTLKFNIYFIFKECIIVKLVLV